MKWETMKFILRSTEEVMFSHVKRYSLDSDKAFFLIWDPATVDDKKVQRKQLLYYNCKTTLQWIVAVAEV